MAAHWTEVTFLQKETAEEETEKEDGGSANLYRELEGESLDTGECERCNVDCAGGFISRYWRPSAILRTDTTTQCHPRGHFPDQTLNMQGMLGEFSSEVALVSSIHACRGR